MPEYVTKPLDRTALLQLVQDFQEATQLAGIGTLSVSYGWDCELEIDEMWKPTEVAVVDLSATLLRSESEGLLTIGQGDVFIAVAELKLRLCHESDAHLEGSGALFQNQLRQWQERGYEPSLNSSQQRSRPANSSGTGNSGA